MLHLERELRALAPAPGEAVAAARRFVARADAEGLVDVAYALVDSPLGSLVAAATQRGLVRVAFGAESLERTLGELSARLSPRVLEHPARLDAARRQLDEYFDGRRRSFDLDVDLGLVGAFQAKVLAAARAIPFGSVVTYADMATRAGHPGAARAAGTALARNPVPIVVPCHRILRSGGGLGGYAGGLERKRFLLELEGLTPGGP